MVTCHGYSQPLSSVLHSPSLLLSFDRALVYPPKNGAMLELQEIVFSLRSELSECRGACERYQRELSEERKARRELEKGTE